jgi:hypothetical protein
MSWAAIGSATVPPPPPRYQARRRAALNGRPDRRRQPAPLPPRPRRLRSGRRLRHSRGVAAVHLRRGGAPPGRALADGRPALADSACAGGRPLHRDRDRAHRPRPGHSPPRRSPTASRTSSPHAYSLTPCGHAVPSTRSRSLLLFARGACVCRPFVALRPVLAPSATFVIVALSGVFLNRGDRI